MALQQVDTTPKHLTAYDGLAAPAVLEEVRSLATQLRGLRVAHINATPSGGGVAEILRSIVPLMQGIGLDVSWYVLPPEDAFFAVTKQFHNALQGRPGRLTQNHRGTYLAYLERVAASMRNMHADVWVIHDPQPLALRQLVPLRGATIWRCHIDCSAPNPAVRDYLLPWVHAYDRAFFSMPEYVLPGMRSEQVRIVHPAIDPLLPKNHALPETEVDSILSELRVDPRRPLMTQVSRFDPWKNPWQVVDAYRIAKMQVPDLQLAMLGVFDAKDDPEGPKIYRAIRRYAGRDPDVHLFTDASRVGPREVNAFQAGSTVMLQRSTREGFGLSVTEAMWKARPVVATPVGGITAQIQHERTGYLVASTEDCADWTVRLLRQPELAHTIGQAARHRVSQDFLLPRLLRDDLKAYSEVISGSCEQVAA